MTKLLNRNNKAGFTLVELIVVIAILAILAGIAIPVYNGYIKKADKAADEQLLGAVNTAFAAACLENGFNAKDATAASLTVSYKKITGVSSVTVPAEKVLLTAKNEGYGPVLLGAHPAQLAVDEAALTASVNTSFLKYFGTNTNTPLRVYTTLTFDPATGTFSGEAKAGALKAGYEWKFTNTTQAALQDAYEASSFSEIEVSQLTGTIDSLTKALSDHSKVRELADGENFKAMLNGLNIDPTAVDDQTLGNLAVFFVADQLSTLTKSSELIAALKEDVKGTRGTDGNYTYTHLDTYLSGKGLDPNALEGQFVKTALLYGLATSYANSGFANDAEKTALNDIPSGLTSAMNIINTATKSDGWGNYIRQPIGWGDYTGTEDIDAFLLILSTLNDNQGAFSTYSGQSFYSDPDILAQIESILTP